MRQSSPLLEFEETRGWSSSESDGSYMEDSESEEAGSIDARFVPTLKVATNPSKSEEINEEPFDMQLSDADIESRIVARSAQLVDQLKQVRS